MSETITVSVPELQFNVSQLLKETTGATRSYQIKTDAIRRLDDDVRLIAPLAGAVTLLRTGQDILVNGTLQTIIEKSCGRCLRPFSASVSIELEEIFFPSIDLFTGTHLAPPPDADEANRINEVHTLDLSEVVRQALLLEIEGVRYCTPDCKGLCPHCGQDRNINPCNCADEVVDMRWSGLLSFELED
jgi:uncharacterized protein